MRCTQYSRSIAGRRLRRRFRAPARGLGALLPLVAAVATGIPPIDAMGMCDVIPGVVQEFRGALGSLNRPYAFPAGDGQQITITLDPSGCDDPEGGFLDLPGGAVREDDYFVTVLFEPPNGGPRNAVVLTTTTNLELCRDEAAEAEALLDGGSGTCPEPEPGIQEFEIVVPPPPEPPPDVPTTLRFLFPDTDEELAPDDDDITYTGPATIAVTPVSDPLPFGLATSRCADTPGLVACVDEIYARDGTCETGASHSETGASHIHPVFGNFTALPPANNYQALCTTTEPGAPCEPVPADERQLRFTTDAAGNVLVPMDYSGVRVLRDEIPIPRLILGDTRIRAFLDEPAAVALPSDAFIASYSPGGHRLPPVFTPISNPEAEAADPLSLFGSVDSAVGVIRVTRQGCVGGAQEGDSCTIDDQCRTDEAPDATCEELFDFRNRYAMGDGGTMSAQDAMGDGDTMAAQDATGVGPVLLGAADFELRTENPVPLDGLIESESLFAFVANEAIGEVDDCDGDGEPDCAHLNDDGDARDPVLRIRDHATGEILPIGTGGADGRAATRVKDGRFRFPAVAVEGDIVAFLELEPLEGNCAFFAGGLSVCDKNQNSSVFDPILRMYRVVEDCGDGNPCAKDLTGRLFRSIAVDAAPLVEGRSIAISDGLVYFRTPEWRQAPQVTRLVSVNSDGEVGDHSSEDPSLSSDGRVVAFESIATNFDPRKTNTWRDVFVHDRLTEVRGPTELVSVNSDGEVGNHTSEDPSLSSDGRLVAFESIATNFDPRKTNTWRDVFVHDRDTGVTELVSVNSDGFPGNSISEDPSLSSDGRLVAFESRATNFYRLKTRTWPDVFVRDRDKGETKLVSVNSDGAVGNRSSEDPSLSSDGWVVAFESIATNFDPRKTETWPDVFVHDRATGVTELVSVHSDGRVGNHTSEDPSLSSDGQVVAFTSLANNIVTGDTNGAWDIFVHDRATGETERVSVSSHGHQGIGSSAGASLSSDGRLVAFESRALNLGSYWDIGKFRDVFVHDRVTGATELVSVNSDGSILWGDSRGPSLSSDGRLVAFESRAKSLDPDKTETWPDVFVRGPDPSHGETFDLTGDSDLDDTVLQVFDTRPGSRPGAFTLGAAGQVAVSAGAAAFLVPESASGVDRNGDGDTDDAFVHLFTNPGIGLPGTVQDLNREAVAIAMSSEVVAALVPSGPAGETVVGVYDWASPAPVWTMNRLPADLLDAVGSVVAYRGVRLGRLFLYDAATATITVVGEAAEEFVLGENILAFRTRECDRVGSLESERCPDGGTDRNGDGDPDDDVLQVFDLVTERLFKTKQAVTPCPLEACDPRFPYRVEGDTVTFVTSEAAQSGPVPVPGCQSTVVPGECDLNGDGDADDLVKQVFNAREAALLAPLSGEAADFVDTIAAASAGICTTTGLACASNADCGAGSCYLPPGGCIRDLGPLWPCTCTESGCSGCNDDEFEFCVPFPGGDGEGTCHVNEGPCASQADCEEPAVCTNTEADVQRLFAPVSTAKATSGETVFSSGICVEGQRRFGSCRTDDDCRPGLTCAPRLVTVNAADTDEDDLADPFDNCPRASNIDQADLDGDGIGDACDLMTCGNGVREFSEECDDGNSVDHDGCNSDCTIARCDVNGDGDVDRFDVEAIFGARGENATGPDDPMDADGDGIITVNDGRICVLACTNPNCEESAGGGVTGAPEPGRLLLLVSGILGLAALYQLRTRRRRSG